MRLSPIIKKLFKNLAARLLYPCFSKTLATASISAATAVVAFVALPSSFADDVIPDDDDDTEEIIRKWSLQGGAGEITLGQIAPDDTATIYFAWGDDTRGSGNNQLLRLKTTPMDAAPTDTDKFIAVNFKKVYGDASLGEKHANYLTWNYFANSPAGDLGIERRGLEDKTGNLTSAWETRYGEKESTGYENLKDTSLRTFVVYGSKINGEAAKDIEEGNLFYNVSKKAIGYLYGKIKDTDGNVEGGVFIRNNIDNSVKVQYARNIYYEGSKIKYNWRPEADSTMAELPEGAPMKDGAPIVNLEIVDRDFSGGLIVSNKTALKDGADVTTLKVSHIDHVQGDFIGNYVKSNVQIFGGLIYNGFLGYIGSIKDSNFIGNYFSVETDNITPHGGVIYNHVNGTIGEINNCYFVGNFLYADSTKKVTDANGALYAPNDPRLKLGEDYHTDVIGGVITNHGLIEKGVHGTFIGNYAYAINTANSGVLRNFSAVGYAGRIGANEEGVSISGQFIGNFTRAKYGDAYGGIMRNNSEIQGKITGYYYGNHAQSDGNMVVSHYTYTVDRENVGEGHYKYVPELDDANDDDKAYVLYDGEDNKEDYYLKREVVKRYHTGERTGLAQGGVFYNTIKTDGSGATATILNDIDADFECNYALSKWSEASGGAIYNQDAIIGNIEGSFTGNYAASLAHMARGGAIYNKLQIKPDTGVIQDIGSYDEGTLEKSPVDFVGNYAQGRIAGGGAIYSSSYSKIGSIYASFKGNYAKSVLGLTEEEDLKLYNDPSSHFVYDDSLSDEEKAKNPDFDKEKRNCPDYYEYRARGGAIFVDNFADVGNIFADFEHNYAQSTEAGAKVRGGAILVTTGATIGHIANYDADGKESLAKFVGNYALGNNDKGDGSYYDETFGGAIRFDASVIDKLSAHFSQNWTTGSGGALSVTNSGFIYQVTGDFVGNKAGHFGGAVHNEGTIGYLGSLVMENGELVPYIEVKALEDLAEYDNVLRDADGRIVTRSDETVTSNKAGYKEYDGTIRGGFIDTSFTNNEVNGCGINLVEREDGFLVLSETNEQGDAKVAQTRNGERGLGGAIYTNDNLFITATDPTKALEFSGNSVVYTGGDDHVVEKDGEKRLNTALYVDSSSWTGENPIAIYLVSREGATMRIYDAIRGADHADDVSFVLRLRGFTEKRGAMVTDADGIERKVSGGGIIYISGPVAQSYAIMDDVHLQIGQCINYFSFGNDITLDQYLFGENKDKDFGRSDVFRKSHLSVRSGHVDLTADDSELTQFAFNSLISYGNTYRYADNGTNDAATKAEYKEDDLFATWSVDIDGDKRQADLITTFEERDANGEVVLGKGSKGAITLSAINIRRAGGDDYVFNGEDTKDYPILDEGTLKVQILNLVVRDAEHIYTEEEYKQLGYLDDAPIQLDNQLNVVKWESSIMDSSEVLAEDIRLSTTRTYHDSIEIVGWRDSLAAWAEMTDDIKDSKYDEAGWVWDEDTARTQSKVFTLVADRATYDLTRDVVDLKGDKKTPTDGAVWGTNWTIRGDSAGRVLNLNKRNLLSVVKEGQNARLEFFALKGLRDQKILNEGNLTLDTMQTGDEKLTVDNQNTLTLQGYMQLDKRYTITTEEAAANGGKAADGASEWKKLFINDKTEVSHLKARESQKSVLDITDGTITKQDITHQGSAVQSPEALMIGSSIELTKDILADSNFTTVTNLFVTDGDGKPTAGFTNFSLNALTMEGGKFNLGNMEKEVLQLRGLHMQGGLIHVASSTVNLKDEVMGGLRGESLDGSDNASYTGGVIWLDHIKLEGDGKEKVTHVKFVTEGAGDAVRDNHIRNNKAEGDIWTYAVTYNDPTQVNSRGETGRNGYYTFVRLDEAAPPVLVGPVAEAAGGVASLMQVNEFVFEHADLFSTNMYNAQRARLYERSYTVVTPSKGKNNVQTFTKTTCSDKAAFKGGMWVRPYASYEKLPLNNGPKVTNNLYGALVGGDTAVSEYRNGWASVFSAHAAYMGSTQRYTGNASGVRIHQNGGAVGITETLYKHGFYTALTGTIGTSSGHASTASGTENFRMLIAGVASRSGYNFTFGDGKVTLQPTLLMSYTLVNVNDYTNAGGTRMESDPLQVFQLHPYLKAVLNTESCWQPYVTAGYVHNFAGKTKFRANGDKLPEMSIDPYVEYSIGAQKTWADKYTIFGEATGRNGGRNGVEFSAGLRWAW